MTGQEPFDEQTTADGPGDGRAVRRLRMPVEDRISPEEWVAEQPPAGPSPTVAGEADHQAARRRFEIEWGAGG